MSISVPLTYLFEFEKTDKAARNSFLAQFAACGVKHLVLSSPLLNIMAESRDTTADIKREMESFGLSFCDSHLPYSEHQNLNCPYPEERKSLALRIKMYMTIAAYFGVDTMTCHLGNDVLYPDIPMQTHIDRACSMLEAILPEAEKLNITLCLENIFVRSSTPEILLDLVKKFDSPNLALCFDAGHANTMEKGHLVPDSIGYRYWKLSETEPPWEDSIVKLKRMLPYVVNAHLHDNGGIGDHHNMPGNGNINWREILPVLLSAPRLKVLQSEVQMFRNGLGVKETVESFERIFADVEAAK